MGAPVKLAGFAAGLVAVFGLAFGVGRAVGPADDAPVPATTTTTAPLDHEGHP